MVVEGDVTDTADCLRFTATALETFGKLDILVNNVGVMSDAVSVVEMQQDTWQQMINLNLNSVYLMSKHAIPAMVETGGGSIINISSITALRGGWASPAYSAAKGGALTLTLVMATQHGPQGIHVNAVVPGHIDTPHRNLMMSQFPRNQEMNKMVNDVLPLGQTTARYRLGHRICRALLGERRVQLDHRSSPERRRGLRCRRHRGIQPS